MPLPRYHAAVSLGVAALVVTRTRRWRDALPVLAAGVLVDLDHLVDLGLHHANSRFDFIVLPLHAWEWVFALLARNRRVTDQLAGGLAAHLALDQGNSALSHPLVYWISVRAWYGFRASWPLADPDRYARSSGWMHAGPLGWL